MNKLKKYFPPIVIGLLSSAVVAVGALTIGGTSVTSDGALSITAGGTDQNITLTPSGTGSILTTANLAVGTTTATYLFTVATTSQIFSVSANGNVGIGIAPLAGVQLYNVKAFGDVSDVFGGYFDVSTQPVASSDRSVTGLYVEGGTLGNFNNTGTLRGASINAISYQGGEATIATITGLRVRTQTPTAGGGATTFYGIQNVLTPQGTAFTNVYGIHTSAATLTASAITNYYGNYIADPGGAITNAYGLYLENQTRGTTLNYSIYSAGGTNYFAGNTGIGTAFPSSTLHVVGTVITSATTTFAVAGGNVGVANSTPGALLDVGLAGTTLGVLRLAGNTSGNVTIQPSATAGTWTLTLPTSSGSNGYTLTTDGNGVTSWATPAAGSGYTLQAEGQGVNAADATTYYIGASFSSTYSTTGDTKPIYIPKAGTLTAACVWFRNTGGTAETSTVSFRLNDTTDTIISTSTLNNSANSSVCATGLSTAVVAGDRFEIKWVTPTWATNPTNVRVSAVAYIE
jgi:hypothetical protein